MRNADPSPVHNETPTTATGGSARSQANESTDDSNRRWRSNMVLAWTVRFAVYVIPFAAGYVGGAVTADLLPHPIGAIETVAWWQTVLAGSGLGVLAGRMIARIITPLSVLYKMSLVFPDAAPSRYKMALKRSSARELARRVEAGEPLGATPAEAAENIVVLLGALNDHDRLTRGHSERVRAYSDLIAVELGLDDEDREKLHWAALIHDVGKLHVDGEILRKDGRPTESEWAELRGHPAAAEGMLEPLRPWLGDWLTAATQHHERFDGDGYPYGLAGRQIGFAGRIVAVADAYDTMTSTRSYKAAWSAEEARAELVACSGSQFDPDMVKAFLSVSVRQTSAAAGPMAWLAQTPRLAELASTATSATGNVAARVGLVVATSTAAVPAVAAMTEPDPIEIVAAAPAEEPVALAFTETTAPATSAAPTTTTPESTSSTTAAPTTTLAATTTALPSTTVAPTSLPPTTTDAVVTTTTTEATTTTSTSTTTTVPPTTTTSPPPDQNVQWLTMAPPTFANGEVRSDSEMFLLAEPGPTNFDAATTIFAVVNTSAEPITEAALGSVTIDAATTICSVFVHLDPFAPSVTIDSTITVSGEILGIISTDALLAATHYLAGTATTWDYDYFGSTDTIARLGPRTVQIVGKAGTSSNDQLRIIHSC